MKYPLLLLSLLIVLPAPSQRKYYPFENFSIQDGLRDESICSGYQDHLGYLWFGANRGGLARYDGYQFKTYRTNANNTISGLTEPAILAIFEDSYHNLWVGTASVHVQDIAYRAQKWLRDGVFDDQPQNQGNKATLFRLDQSTGQFISYLHFPDDPIHTLSSTVSTIFEDQDRQLWVGTHGQGLYKIDLGALHAANWNPEGVSYQQYRHDPTDKTSIPSDYIHHRLMQGKAGSIWFPTHLGLVEYNAEKSVFSLFQLAESKTYHTQNHFFTATESKRNEEVIWIGSVTGGLLRFNKRTRAFKQHQHVPGDPYSLENNFVTALLEDRTGKLWVGSGIDHMAGIATFDPNTQQFTYLRDASNPTANILLYGAFTIVEDYSESVWIGSRGMGIFKYHPSREQFTFLESRPGYTDGIIDRVLFDVMEDRHGKIWIATENSGLIQWDRTDNSFRYLPHEPSNPNSINYNRCTSVMEDRDGNIWVSTMNGIDRIDQGTGQFTHYLVQKDIPGKLNHDRVFYLQQDEEGMIWAATYGGGVYRLDDPESGDFTHFSIPADHPQSVSLNTVNKLIKDGMGSICASTSGGLMKFDPRSGQFQVVFPEPLRDVVFDQHNNAWMATMARGLVMLDLHTQERTSFEDSPALLNATVRGVQMDNRNHLWAVTGQGLVELDTDQKKVIGVYSYQKWAPSAQNWVHSFMRTSKNSKGELFFTSQAGLLLFHPDSLKKNRVPPKVVITDFRLLRDGESSHPDQFRLRPGEPLRLSHSQNDFAIHFAATHYQAPEKNQYTYYLENDEDDWRYVNQQRMADYTNVSPGSYVFKVRAANADGIWSETSTDLQIIILPPWWRTWWAYGLYLLSILAGLYGFYRFQLNRQLMRAEALRLKEMDAVKTQLYTNITHEFRTPLTVIQGMADQVVNDPEQWLSSGVSAIKRNARQLLRLINQLLDIAKLESGEVELKLIQGDIIAYLRYLLESFHSYAAGNQITLHFIADSQPYFMDYDPERMVQIINNLLSNAIKFTPQGGAIYLELITKTEGKAPQLEVKVRDTGVGIPPDKLPHIFDRFYQVDDSTTRSGEGTGIGLALTKELVQLTGGSIEVHSVVDEGTVFTVCFPVTRTAPKAPESASATVVLTDSARLAATENTTPLEEAPTAPEQLLVLIIEDNFDVRQYISACLPSSFRLVTADNGQSGIDKALELIPDLILSDIMMPEKDGFAVCNTLKNDPRTSHIPLILLTAKADVGSRLAGLRRGADAYLTKPFNREELLIRMRTLLELRRKLQHYYQSLVANGTTTGTEEVPESEAPEHAFVQQIREIIDAHLADPQFTVEDLCREAAMSNSQLYRKLKAVAGLSANHLIRSIRLNKSKALLRDQKLTVASVAFDCGFRDPAYFHRVFKQTFGMTPMEFREQG